MKNKYTEIKNINTIRFDDFKYYKYEYNNKNVTIICNSEKESEIVINLLKNSEFETKIIKDNKIKINNKTYEVIIIENNKDLIKIKDILTDIFINIKTDKKLINEIILNIDAPEYVIDNYLQLNKGKNEKY